VCGTNLTLATSWCTLPAVKYAGERIMGGYVSSAGMGILLKIKRNMYQSGKITVTKMSVSSPLHSQAKHVSSPN